MSDIIEWRSVTLDAAQRAIAAAVAEARNLGVAVVDVSGGSTDEDRAIAEAGALVVGR